MIAWPKPDEVGHDTNGFKKKKQNILVNQLLKQTMEAPIKIANWMQVLNMGINNCSQDALKGMIRQGIPDKIRRDIWPALIKGNTPDYQKILEQPVDEKTAKIIELDLERTFPDNIYFVKNHPCYQAMRKVLNCLSIILPEMGYCQGLNFIVGTLVLRLPEKSAFNLAYYILRGMGHGKLLIDLKRIKIDLYVLDRLVEKNFKQFYNHLKKYEVDSMTYGTSWFITLYCGCLPFEYNLRIIQLYLSQGKKILFRVALAILKYKKRRAKSMTSFENTLMFLKNFDDFTDVPVADFINQMFSFSVSRKEIEYFEGMYQTEKSS